MWNKLYLASMDSGTPREIVLGNSGQFDFGERTVAWFPDGKHLSLWGFQGQESGPSRSKGAQLGGPRLHPRSHGNCRTCHSKTVVRAQSPIFAGRPPVQLLDFVGLSGGVWNLWKVSVDAATLRWKSLDVCYDGPEAHTDLAISRDGRRLAFTPRATEMQDLGVAV